MFWNGTIIGTIKSFREFQPHPRAGGGLAARLPRAGHASHEGRGTRAAPQPAARGQEPGGGRGAVHPPHNTRTACFAKKEAFPADRVSGAREEGGPRYDAPRTQTPRPPPCRQPSGKLMVSLVNSHTSATRIGWHMWEIDVRFASGLPRGWCPPESHRRPYVGASHARSWSP